MDTANILYYNANIISSNVNNNSFANADLAVFSESRDVPIINDISQYEMSIIRFNINGSKNLPVWMPSITIGQSDPTLTTYSIKIDMTFQYSTPTTVNPFNVTLSSTQHIYWSPEDNRAPPPFVPVTTVDLTSNYYYGYSYDHFCDLFNLCVINCYYDLKVQLALALTAAGENPITVQMSSKFPTLSYDPVSKLFSLYTDCYSSGTNTSLGTTKKESLNISFDNDLWGLLGTFDYSVGSDNFYKINVVNRLGNNIFVPANASTGNQDSSLGVFYVTRQNFVSTSMLWNPIDSIVFSSNLLPSENEYTGKILSYGQNNTQLTTSSTAFQPIITDFSVFMDSANNWHEFISYNPSAEYRMNALTNSQSSLKNIDLQLYWKHRLTNNLYPIRLYNNSSISIKIMFRKKPIYNNY